MCKVDYIHIVKEIMSQAGARTASGAALDYCIAAVFCLFMLAACRSGAGAIPPKQVDFILFLYIITITYGRAQGSQTRPSPSTGCPASPPRSGHRRTVPGQQLFRPRRFDPGQIRDAAAGRGRTDPGQPGGARSRALAALFLSSPGSPTTGWVGRTDPAKARTARGPQDNGCGFGLPRRATYQPARSEIPRISPAGQRTNGRDGSSTHHRTGVIPKSKKTPLNGGPWRRQPDSGMLREQYEQIRQRALERTATGIGIGSDLAMRRGMRSWMEAGGREEFAPVTPAPTEGRLQPDRGLQQMAAVWASVFVEQAERSHRGL